MLHFPAGDAPRLMRRATDFSIIVAIILIVTKAWAWSETGSVSLLAALLENVLDIGTSLIAFVAVRVAVQPPDDNHRFGHGKVESLASLMQAMLILVSAGLIIWSAIGGIVDPRPIERGEIAIAVMVFSLVLTIGLVIFQYHVIKRTGSHAIAADHLHYKADILLDLGVITSIASAYYLGWPYVDSIFALGIAFYIVAGLWGIVRRAFGVLLDQEFQDADRQIIRDIVMRHADVKDFHDLKTRSSGLDEFVQIHVELDGAMPLRRVHEICDEVECDIRRAFPRAEVIIHADPEGLENEVVQFAD